jgi:hypothetical protein
MKKLEWILVVVLLILGIAHIALTPVFFPQFNEAFIWFAGTGLAFVNLALLNFARLMTTSVSITRLGLIANLLATVLVALLPLASKTFEPQVLISLVVLVLLVVATVKPALLKK